MLQLQVNETDICMVAKLLFKFSIKAKITEREIILDGDLSDELFEKLCNVTQILAFGNFLSEDSVTNKESFEAEPEENETDFGNYSAREEEYKEDFIEPKAESEEYETDFDRPYECEIVSEEYKTSEEVENYNGPKSLSHAPEDSNLIYSKVKRGEIYWCDFGTPYGHEQGFRRPVVIVQNEAGNVNSPTTIVLPFTTAKKTEIPTHYNFKISSDATVNGSYERNVLRNSVIMAEQIQTIDKTRLREYMGMFTPEFMEGLQEYIDISLDLRRESKVIVQEKKVYVAKPVIHEVMVDKRITDERRDVNLDQIKVLSLVNINELFEISNSTDTDKDKAKSILKLFGFNLKKKGVWYLCKAIYMAPKNEYFDLDKLARRVSESEDVEQEEVKRQIIARIKENFGLRKSIAIDFIRLVTTFV